MHHSPVPCSVDSGQDGHVPSSPHQKFIPTTMLSPKSTTVISSKLLNMVVSEQS